MTRPSLVRPVLFLGAGASRFAGFPGVDSFFESVDWPQSAGFSAACEELARKTAIAEKTQENLQWPHFNAEKILGRLETLERAAEINDESSVIHLPTQKMPISVHDLISHLRSEIVRIYGTETDTDRLKTAPHESLFRLLESLTLHSPEPLYVFTTNYDTVVEQLFEDWNASKQVFQGNSAYAPASPPGAPGSGNQGFLRRRQRMASG